MDIELPIEKALPRNRKKSDSKNAIEKIIRNGMAQWRRITKVGNRPFARRTMVNSERRS